MASDSWAQAVDEQEAAAESVSVKSASSCCVSLLRF